MATRSCNVSAKICNLFLYKAGSPSRYSLDNSIGNKPELFMYDIKRLPSIDKTDQEESSNQSAPAPGGGEERLRRAKIIILE